MSGRTIRRDVERLRELGYPVESLTGPAGGYRLRAGDGDAAAAARRGRGDRDRGRAAHGRARVGDRHRGDLGARARQARAGAAGAPAPARRGARRGDGRAGRRRPDRRPAAPDARSPPPAATPSACASRYRSRDGTGHPPRGRAARARQPRPALVPRRLGPRPRRLAHVPRRPARPAAPATGARFTPRTLPAADAAAYVEQSIAGAEPLRGARHASTRRPTRSQRRLPCLGGAVTPIDARPLRVPHRRRRSRLARAARSRCSAPTSTSTSRPSCASTCARSPADRAVGRRRA